MVLLTDILGGKAVIAREPASAYDWIEQVEAGLPASSALAFKEAASLSAEELSRLLGVSTRTISRWESGRSLLDAVTGDRLLRAARLYAIAMEVLESSPAATRWLKSPQRALGGAVPFDLARTDVGCREVEELLGRMEHGVYS